MKCSRCDGPGAAVTFANQACMAINGKVQCIDWCIHQIVAALNAGGVETVASCCGHGTQDGTISLADGRDLIVRKGSVMQGDADVRRSKCPTCGEPLDPRHECVGVKRCAECGGALTTEAGDRHTECL